MKLIYLVTFLFSFNAYAGVEVQTFDNQQEEQTYKKLIDELRCLVCQNQNLADSNAELAQDLRKKIVEMIEAGKSEQQIVDYMVARYGDFVLYRPPLNKNTILLWAGPFLILLMGLFVLVVFVTRQKNREKPSLSEQQQQRARKLLDEDEGDD